MPTIIIPRNYPVFFAKINNGSNAFLVYVYMKSLCNPYDQIKKNRVPCSLEEVRLQLGWNPTKFKSATKILKDYCLLETTMEKDDSGKYMKSIVYLMEQAI